MHLNFKIVLLFVFLPFAGLAADRTLIVPDDFVWIEFSTWKDEIGGGAHSAVFAKHGTLVRLEGLSGTKKAPVWYDGQFKLDPLNPERREKQAASPLLFTQLQKLVGSQSNQREVSLRATKAVLYWKRDDDGLTQELWIDAQTGHPLRYFIVKGSTFSWTEYFSISNDKLSVDLFLPQSDGPELRQIYSEKITHATDVFAIILRTRIWEKDVAELTQKTPDSPSSPR